MKDKKLDELKPIEITLDSKIDYKAKHPSFGRAEFQICPVFKRGYIRELFIYRKQQEARTFYHLDLESELEGSRINVFSITAWSHETDYPRIWRNFWCKEHKTISFEVYVPDNTDTIEFSFHFGNTLDVRFVKK